MKPLSRASFCAVLWAASLASTIAQAPPTSGQRQAAPRADDGGFDAPASSAPAKQAPSDDGGGMLGKSAPMLDPSSETMAWDGKLWNVGDNRLVRARFEKYLNAPEEVSEEDLAYQKILREIFDKLSPGKVNPKVLDEAWAMLPQASNYSVDAKLCDALADAVYTVWNAKKEVARINSANDQLLKQQETLEWNRRLAAEGSPLSGAIRGANAAEKAKAAQEERNMKLAPFEERLVEVKARKTANNAKKEVSEIQAKIEFQTLTYQLFMQRRFHHVLIANRFYRALFGDGDQSLKISDSHKQTLTGGSGLPATVSLLDSLANEAVRDVDAGVNAFKFLAAQNEMSSATQRLQENYAVGEFLAPIRTLPRELKRKALDFTQKTNKLLASIEVKDYSEAEKLVADLATIAKDFDTTKATAAIETARTVSAMHLAKAKLAATHGDQATFEREIQSAMKIWPRNPDLALVSKEIFKQSDTQNLAINDLDRLISLKNYRQIFEDRAKFIAATALSPDKAEALKQVLEKMQLAEGAIMRASEIARRGDTAGAWESIEKAYAEFPDDPKLTQLRADYTMQATDFVHCIKKAQDLERREQAGSSLAWYLKAQKSYPASDYAKEGIQRMVQKILPENSPGQSSAR